MIMNQGVVGGLDLLAFLAGSAFREVPVYVGVKSTVTGGVTLPPGCPGITGVMSVNEFHGLTFNVASLLVTHRGDRCWLSAAALAEFFHKESVP